MGSLLENLENSYMEKSDMAGSGKYSTGGYGRVGSIGLNIIYCPISHGTKRPYDTHNLFIL